MRKFSAHTRFKITIAKAAPGKLNQNFPFGGNGLTAGLKSQPRKQIAVEGEIARQKKGQRDRELLPEFVIHVFSK